MQPADKYSKISAWPQHILIHNLQPLEKDRKSEHENLRKRPVVISWKKTSYFSRITPGYIQLE